MTSESVEHFLRLISRRQRNVSLARRARLFLLSALGAYAVALLFSRLGGLLPGWGTPLSLAIFSTGAVALAWVFYPRPDRSQAARLAEVRLGTPDLFLTAAQIGNSLGAYQELVLREAEQRAAKILPRTVVPYPWQPGALQLAAALGLVSLGLFFLPQFDPFGLHQRQQQLAVQQERVRAAGKATAVRAALLDQKRAGESTDAVKQAIATLEKTLQGAKANDPAGTLARLNEQQKALGQLWKQASEEKLKNSLNLPPPAQSFGLADPAKTGQLKNDLQKGDVASTRKELEELKQQAQELAAAQDPVAREKLRQELMDRLQALKNTLDQQLGSQAVNADLQRAMEQLAMASTPELAGEALKRMSDSLKLTQDEL